MKKIAIRTWETGRTLFESSARSLREAVEQAVRENIALDGADLIRANLSGGMLDGARLRGARLRGANLTGVNMSESDCAGTDLREAVIHGGCLACSDFSRSSFEFASFGATDISGAVFSGCRFSGLSVFTLDFSSCKAMQDATYTEDSLLYPLTSPPVVIHGLRYPIIFLDRHLKIGCAIEPYEKWAQLGLQEIRRMAQTEGQMFFARHSAALQLMALATGRMRTTVAGQE